MKLKIADYEVEIKARHECRSLANDRDTMALLNLISLWAREAAEREKADGYPLTAKQSHEAAENIYDALADKGYYKLRQTFEREGVGDVEMP